MKLGETVIVKAPETIDDIWSHEFVGRIVHIDNRDKYCEVIDQDGQVFCPDFSQIKKFLGL